jgi:dihydrofolate reductase
VAARLSAAKLLYPATMSADGFIAGPGGDMSWLGRFLGSGDKAAGELPRMTGSLLVGRRTYGVCDRTAVEVEPTATWSWFKVLG